MAKIKVDDHTIKGDRIDFERIEIVVDDSKPDKIEIYILDENGERAEGGSFDRDAFMQSVRAFYDQYF
jgi:hypothetical protein